MKTIIFLFSLIICIHCYSQINVNALSKYSYFIYGNTSSNSIEHGTGFFLKKNNIIHFVTSAHLIKSWDYKNNKKPYPEIDTFFLRLPIKGSNKFYFLKIITKNFTNLPKNDFFLDTKDLCFLKLSLPKKCDINVIEISKSSYKNDLDIENVIVYGYPVNDSINDKSLYLKIQPSLSSGILKTGFNKPLRWVEINRKDSIHLAVIVKNGECKGGISGAPLFFKLNNLNTYIFGGMVILGDTKFKILTAIRPEIIYTELNNKN